MKFETFEFLVFEINGKFLYRDPYQVSQMIISKFALFEFISTGFLSDDILLGSFIAPGNVSLKYIWKVRKVV